jgi:hypothetical protein
LPEFCAFFIFRACQTKKKVAVRVACIIVGRQSDIIDRHLCPDSSQWLLHRAFAHLGAET